MLRYEKDQFVANAIGRHNGLNARWFMPLDCSRTSKGRFSVRGFMSHPAIRSSAPTRAIPHAAPDYPTCFLLSKPMISLLSRLPCCNLQHVRGRKCCHGRNRNTRFVYSNSAKIVGSPFPHSPAVQAFLVPRRNQSSARSKWIAVNTYGEPSLHSAVFFVIRFAVDGAMCHG